MRPLPCLWLEDVLWPNISFQGSFLWFWCACSVYAEKPKEIKRHPPIYLGSKTSQHGIVAGVLFNSDVEKNGLQKISSTWYSKLFISRFTETLRYNAEGKIFKDLGFFLLKLSFQIHLIIGFPKDVSYCRQFRFWY